MAKTFFMIGSILVGIAAVILYRKPQAVQYQTRLTLVWLSFVSGIGLLYFTIQQISAAYRAALEANSDPGIWPQVIVISAGMVVLERRSQSEGVLEILAADFGSLCVPDWRLDPGWRTAGDPGFRR